MMLEGFLLGVICTSSIIAGLIFLRFWRDTKDSFFLLFAASFVIEGLNRMTYLLLDRPNEGAPWIYIVRLVAFSLILVAILRKNADRG